MLLVPQYNVTTVVHSDEVKIACLYGDELVISSKKKSPKKPRPPWIAIGNGMPNKAFTNYPYEMTLLELTSDEAADPHYRMTVMKGRGIGGVVMHENWLREPTLNPLTNLIC